MKKNIYYRYNPDTDNYERIFPTFKSRMAGFARLMISSLAMASLLLFLGMVIFDAPTEKNLRKENAMLKSRYNILNRRLDNSLRIMEDIRNRDDNFYRVMMQESIIKRLKPLQEKYYDLLENPDKLKEIYEKGAKKARERADKIVNEVYRKVGLIVGE